MIQKIKKIAVASAVALSVCLCPALMGTNFVFAQTQNQEYKNVAITNGSFDNEPLTPYLVTSPYGWTGENKTTKKGVINTNTTKFASQAESGYNLKTTENPSKVGEDDNVLMLNARKDNVTHNNHAALDSFVSNNITLEAYSFYQLKVWVKTMNFASASIVLTGLNEEDMLSSAEQEYFHDIQTTQGANAWKDYTFYIQTASQSQTVQLKLALGSITETNQIESSGQVFFDEVSLKKCSENYFSTLLSLEDSNKNNFNVIEYNKYDITPNINLDFENGLEHWERIGTYPNNAQFVADAKKINNIELGGDFSLNNTKALYINAEKDNSVHVGFKSNDFDIKMANTYRISAMIKTADLVGTVSLNLVETDYINETYGTKVTPTTTTITITNTEKNELTNDYQEFVFFVQGYELFDTKAHLEIVFGEENIPASGSVAVDNIKITEYAYNQFKNLDTSKSSYKKVTFTSITGKPTLANGTFNTAYSEGIGVQYPLMPAEWTQTTENKNICVYGVVNTTAWDQIPSNLRPLTTSPNNPAFETSDGIIVPVADTTSNNILMMYNKTGASQSVSSPTFTANANSFYALSFNYRTFGNALTIKVLDADNNAVYTDKIATTTAWSHYKIILKTEHFAVETLKLVLELNSTSIAYAFFDNFQFYTANLDNAGFQTAIDAGKNTIDLSNLGIHQTGDFDATLGIYDAPMFTGNLVSGTQLPNFAPTAFGGIINEKNSFGIEFPSTHTNQVQNMLMLQTQAIADYNFTSKNTIKLTSGEFYKFSVYIKTSFTNPPTDKEIFGAYFGLVGIDDAMITKIISGTMFNQYIIYLAATEDNDVKVQFGLTSNNNLNQIALFDTFNFEKIDQNVFDSAVSSNNVLVLNETTTIEDEENENQTDNNVGASLWIQISTIVMVAAIVIAIVGAMLRKTKIKKFRAKKHAEYVERVSSVRDAHVVEAEKRRNDEVNTLLKEKEHLAIYLKELEEENKKRLAEQRKISGKQITRKAEKEFKIYASNRQRILRDMGRIDDRIKEAQTPEYLARILKLIQNEKIQELEAKDQENK